MKSKRREIIRRCLATLLLVLSGCRAVAPLAAANFSEPGWTVREGQAIWRADKSAPEIAGELLVATRPGGDSVVQFTKTPVPFILAQAHSNAWQFHLVPENRTYSGRGLPPWRIAWLNLPRCLTGEPPPKPWLWLAPDAEHWSLTNPVTGESIDGYLTP
jgi:hypothetical protein